jgi:hypothetical protein
MMKAWPILFCLTFDGETTPVCAPPEHDLVKEWTETAEPSAQSEFWDYSGLNYHYGPAGLRYHRGQQLNPPRPVATPLP